jgi:hypothetical protein
LYVACENASRTSIVAAYVLASFTLSVVVPIDAIMNRVWVPLETWLAATKRLTYECCERQYEWDLHGEKIDLPKS